MSVTKKLPPIVKKKRFWIAAASVAASGLSAVGYAVAGDWSAFFKAAAGAAAVAVGAQ